MIPHWRVLMFGGLLLFLLGGWASPPEAVRAQDGPSPRIAIRQVDGVAEFYHTGTGEAFTPRGANYIVFVRTENGRLENRPLGLSSFDPEQIRADFAKLAGAGYNTVRLFIDSCSTGPDCTGNPSGPGLNPPYMDNLVQTMRIAQEEGVFLLLTSNDLPDEGGYWEQSNRGADEQFAGYRNAHYLTEAGVGSAVAYWTDLMAAMVEREAPFEAVLGFSILNEQWYFGEQPPLSLNEGTVTTANGQTYDLADPAEKRQMRVDGTRHYIARVQAVIKSYAPATLVTMGFFAPQYPNPTEIGGTWVVDTAPLLEESPLDFFDFHAYPGGDLDMPGHAENFGMVGYEAKPVIMGEVGAFRHIYPAADGAAVALQRWIAAACEFGFDGWLYWEYYGGPSEIGDATWGLLAEDGLIFDALAPLNQPDPCQPGGLEVANAALGAEVVASSTLPEEPPENAVDGTDRQWGAGADAPQWIEIRFPEAISLERVSLRVAQWPAGSTTHVVSAMAGGQMVILQTFAGRTRDDDILEVALPAPLHEVSFVRVGTLASPSWVAWKEIEAWRGPEGAAPACLVTAPDNVNLRAGPSTAADITGLLQAGQAAVIGGQASGEEGFTWWRLLSGVWVRDDVVRTAGGCDGVAVME